MLRKIIATLLLVTLLLSGCASENYKGELNEYCKDQPQEEKGGVKEENDTTIENKEDEDMIDEMFEETETFKQLEARMFLIANEIFKAYKEEEEKFLSGEITSDDYSLFINNVCVDLYEAAGKKFEERANKLSLTEEEEEFRELTRKANNSILVSYIMLKGAVEDKGEFDEKYYEIAKSSVLESMSKMYELAKKVYSYYK